MSHSAFFFFFYYYFAWGSIFLEAPGIKKKCTGNDLIAIMSHGSYQISSIRRLSIQNEISNEKRILKYVNEMQN